jgi:hypothetical protein
MAFVPRAGLAGVFRPPLVPPEQPVRETPSASFGDLVRMLAEGIADGQASLDRSSAELVRELAETTVKVVPRITETIDADGNITYDQAPEQDVSLLALGVTPTFYQFSQATVEVAMDVKIVESETETTSGRRSLALFAGTVDVRAERKLNRDVSVHSKLTATLVPVPSPVRLEPARATTTPEP